MVVRVYLVPVYLRATVTLNPKAAESNRSVPFIAEVTVATASHKFFRHSQSKLFQQCLQYNCTRQDSHLYLGPSFV